MRNLIDKMVTHCRHTF